MTNLALVGSHGTNAASAIHSPWPRTMVGKELAEMFPERFNDKTNRVTPRRWLLTCNPGLAQLITEAIGDSWTTDLGQLARLKQFAGDERFQDAFLKVKRAAKTRFANWLKATTGEIVDPDSIFDCHVEPIHEYKRQLLNALHIVVLYNRLRANPGLEVPPRTFFFAGNAAPGYAFAKVVIKFITSVASTVNADPTVNRRLKVVFVPHYCVAVAERLIPAADVSEQISTAGYEASGTSNRKFRMNGALTIGTLDGATVEMVQGVGADNLFLFGLIIEQVAARREWYDPRWHYEHEPETRAALDLIFSEHFNRQEPRIFEPVRDMLLTHGDHYLHLADLKSYGAAHQRLTQLYADRHAWSNKAIRNIASSGGFSAVRAIAEHARQNWRAAPCPIA